MIILSPLFSWEPELSADLDKHEDKLLEHLGKEKYSLFWDLRHSENRSEDNTFNFIGEDQKLLRLIFSSQINSSISLSEYIFKVAHSKLAGSTSVLELGGADGWALDFLQKKYLNLSNLVNVEFRTIWQKLNGKINQIHCTYNDFISPDKFDIVFSILGAPLSGSDELLNCVAKYLKPDGYAFLALRISTDKYFNEIVDKIYDRDLSILPTSSSMVNCGKERIPVICVLNKKSIINENQKLRFVREIFYQYEEVKRMFGMEAGVIYELIKDGESIEVFKKEFDDGWMQFELINKNGIYYLYTTNYEGTKIIQFPYFDSFDFESEMDVCNSNNFWKNSL